jgi:hypothetical protein
MCTLTVIRTATGCRLVHSRDELRTRAESLAPAWRPLPSGRRAIWPTDPDAGGTWIGVRDDGLSVSLLNRNIPPNGRPQPTASRGGLIPDLIDLPDPARILDALAARDLAPVAPFRLLALDAHGCGGLVTWNGLALTEPDDMDPPMCLASSGLGDDKVMVRQPLFESTVAVEPTPRRQDAFHRHRWDDRPEVSVLMSRADARTVSITTVEIARGFDPVFRVEPLPAGEPWCDPVGARAAGHRR